MKKNTVLIVGAAGWKNAGDDLIANALVGWVRTSGAGVIVVGGPHPAAVDASSRIALTGRAIDKLKLALAILSSRYVVIGGGGILDDRYPNFYRPFTRTARLCRILRCKYAFVGIGVGPLQNPRTRGDYSKAVQGADRILVRDEASRDRLILCGVDRHIEIISDPVLWRGELSAAAVVYDLAVSMRRWHTSANPRVGYQGPDDNQLLQAVADAINLEYGPEAHIALISMSGETGDDEPAYLDQLRSKLNARTTPVYSNAPNDVLIAINSSKKILSMRLHVCLVGAVYRKPVVGLSYDPKVKSQSVIHGFTEVSLDKTFAGAPAILSALRDVVPSNPVTLAPAWLW